MFAISDNLVSALSMVRDRPIAATLQAAALATAIIFAPVTMLAPAAMGSVGFIKAHHYSKASKCQNLMTLFKGSVSSALFFLAPMPIRALVTLGYIGYNRKAMGGFESKIGEKFKSLGLVHKAVAFAAAVVFSDIALLSYATYHMGSLASRMTKKGG